jgi:hypothetical protein
MNLLYSAISFIGLLSVFLNFYKQNNILLYPVIWLQVIRHSLRLFDFENDFMRNGDMDWLFLVAVNFVVCIFLFHIAFNYFEITWKSLSIMPLGILITIVSVFSGF